MPYSRSGGGFKPPEGRAQEGACPSIPPFDLTEYPVQEPGQDTIESSIHSVFGYHVTRYAQQPWLKAYRAQEAEPFMQCTGDTAIMAARVVLGRVLGQR